jgi:hypothetical protein
VSFVVLVLGILTRERPAPEAGSQSLDTLLRIERRNHRQNLQPVYPLRVYQQPVQVVDGYPE